MISKAIANSLVAASKSFSLACLCITLAAVAGCKTFGGQQHSNEGRGETMVLQEAWSLPGLWHAVDVEATVGLVALHAVAWDANRAKWTANICFVDSKGIVTRNIPIEGARGMPRDVLRLVRTGKSQSPIIVVANTKWGSGNMLLAYDMDGRLLWTYTAKGELQAVEVSDLNLDGSDEILLGTGGAGLVCLGTSGLEMWRHSQREWIFAVGVAFDGAPNVIVATDGAVQFLDSKGAVVKAIGTSLEYWRLGVVGSVAGRSTMIVGVAGDPLEFEAIGMDGVRKWSRTDRLGGRTYPIDMAIDTDRPWMAITLKDGGVLVYDIRDGSRLASATAGYWSELTWLPPSESTSSLLVVASTNGLRAFLLRDLAMPQSESMQK